MIQLPGERALAGRASKKRKTVLNQVANGCAARQMKAMALADFGAVPTAPVITLTTNQGTLKF